MPAAHMERQASSRVHPYPQYKRRLGKVSCILSRLLAKVTALAHNQPQSRFVPWECS